MKKSAFWSETDSANPNYWNKEKRLKFAIDFAEDKLYGCSLDVFRQGDWLNLRDDIRAFVGLALEHTSEFIRTGTGLSADDFGGLVAEPDEIILNVPESELRRLQKLMKSILHAFVWKEGGDEMPIVPIALKYTVKQGREGTHPLVFAQGPLRDCALMVLINLLKTDTKALLSCPECGNIFYRHRKQIFCSVTCTNRAMQKRFQAKQRRPKGRSMKGEGSDGRQRSTKR